MNFPLENLHPDFQGFADMLDGNGRPDHVYFAELVYDREIVENIYAQTTGEPFPFLEAEEVQRENLSGFRQGQTIKLLTDERERTYYRQLINFYTKMGYDYFPDFRPLRYFRGMIMPRVRVTEDTALLPRKGGYREISQKAGEREWVEESQGVITSWQEFEQFPWDRLVLDLEQHRRFLQETTPAGMKIMAIGSLFEQVLERFLGFEGLFYLLYDDPKLVKAVTDRWAKILNRFYEEVIEWEIVGGIFHADDFGHRSGSLVSPEILKELIFPHLTRYAKLAHDRKKLFWLHSCGNPSELMEDLIEKVKIDAFHSFQDPIMPVAEFKKIYQDRIATLGGVDMDTGKRKVN